MTSPTKTRHPELVSGSIVPPVRSKRRQTNAHRKVAPFGVLAIDQIDLPRSVPALELLLPLNGVDHVSEHLEMDQPVDRVFRGEAGQSIVAVLPHAAEQVRRDADIERAVVLAGEDIDGGVALVSHGTGFAARWTLKQVQGDVNLGVGGIQ